MAETHEVPQPWEPGDVVPKTGRYMAVTPTGHCLGIEAWLPAGWLFPESVAGPGVEVRWVLIALGGDFRRAA